MPRNITELLPGEPFPDPEKAWGEDSSYPGLLAIGGALDVPTLEAAYSRGIFPWFSMGEPIKWFTPDPRMVLCVDEFRLHRSLRKNLKRFLALPYCEIRFDTAFESVMRSCALQYRPGQSGTWILPSMRKAYSALHKAGMAHSVEAWVRGELAAGLYCVNIGRAVFGESMFTDLTDCSKFALSALVAFCRARNLPMIDCQQNTQHLAFMGAQERPRSWFLQNVEQLVKDDAPQWPQHALDAEEWKTIL